MMVIITNLIATKAEIKTLNGYTDDTHDDFIDNRINYTQDYLLNQILFNNFGAFYVDNNEIELNTAYTAGDTTLDLVSDPGLIAEDLISLDNIIFEVSSISPLVVAVKAGTDANIAVNTTGRAFRINEPTFPEDLKLTIANMFKYDIQKDSNGIIGDITEAEIGRVRYKYSSNEDNRTGYPINIIGSAVGSYSKRINKDESVKTI